MTYSGEADGWNAEKKTFLTDPEKPGYYAVTVGIDPTGATPAGVGAPPPASVIWSEPSLQPDDWVRQVIQAKAQGGAVTVYTKGQPQWAVKHNDSWWDDACLRVVGAPAVKAKPVKVKPVGKGAATWN